MLKDLYMDFLFSRLWHSGAYLLVDLSYCLRLVI